MQTHIFPFSSPPKPSAEGKPEKPSQPAADSNPAPGATPPASSPDGLVTQSAYKFQLPLAVSLAGAAFEAYYEPVGAEGFQEMTVNKTETTYTDRYALQTLQQCPAVAVLLGLTMPEAFAHTPQCLRCSPCLAVSSWLRCSRVCFMSSCLAHRGYARQM